MLVKIEFRTGSFLTVDAGDMFACADECRDSFAGLLNGPERFFRFTDFQGRMLIINAGNVNSVEVGYVKGRYAKSGGENGRQPG